MAGEFKPASEIPAAERKREWLRYYSPKRIHEQLLEVRMLAGLPIASVLEIGPYLGLVTAMLDNAGFEVTSSPTTLDFGPASAVEGARRSPTPGLIRLRDPGPPGAIAPPRQR